ncbi:hypothetical protein Enr13x_60070 [Stieleria neptunia]|uniref:Uncharacterized protein n=1 Tax=Stieleria neptunia TaxID=2527979 RepID=A0A518HZ24_9BACT|nr:hypothetical protein Enr13x_60070 [Stieleria neptunia]
MRVPIYTLVLIVTCGIQGCSLTVSPLTLEEKLILQSADLDDSLVVWSNIDKVLIVEVDGNDLVPDQRPATVDAWISAINSLEARGYISNEGHKGGHYELTNAGKAAAETTRISSSE